MAHLGVVDLRIVSAPDSPINTVVLLVIINPVSAGGICLSWISNLIEPQIFQNNPPEVKLWVDALCQALENSCAHVKHFLWPSLEQRGLRSRLFSQDHRNTLAKGNAAGVALLRVDKPPRADSEAFPSNAPRQESIDTFTDSIRTFDGPSSTHTTFDMQKRSDGGFIPGLRCSGSRGQTHLFFKGTETRMTVRTGRLKHQHGKKSALLLPTEPRACHPLVPTTAKR